MTDTTNETAVATAKVDASDLIDSSLDWAIMAALGEPILNEEGLTDDERYSTDWAIGGPLLQRILREEGLLLEAVDPMYVSLGAFKATTDGWGHAHYGPTMLIAGFRAWAASKLGHFVNVPVQYLPKPPRKIRVEVKEHIVETDLLELDIPHDLDLDDKDAVDDFLETAFVEGHYSRIEGERGQAINERFFENLVEVA